MFRRIGVRGLDFQHIPAHGGMDHPGHGSGIAGVGKIRDQNFGLICSRAGRKRQDRKRPRPKGEKGKKAEGAVVPKGKLSFPYRIPM